MRKKNVDAVKKEIKRLYDAIARLEEAKMDQEIDRRNDYLWAPKQTGAVRRASMDLTRALADLRRSPSEK